MKKHLSYIILTIVLLCQAVSAHPGRLDSHGGHYNRTTGEYHYHQKDYETPTPAPKSVEKAEDKETESELDIESFYASEPEEPKESMLSKLTPFHIILAALLIALIARVIFICRKQFKKK